MVSKYKISLLNLSLSILSLSLYISLLLSILSLSLSLSHSLCISLSLYLSLSSLNEQQTWFKKTDCPLLAWETYVNIAKASGVENKQKWNKQ